MIDPGADPESAAKMLLSCILPGAAAAGSVFPQASAGGRGLRLRMDDRLGEGPWLFTRSVELPHAPLSIQVIATDEGRIAPFRADLEAWLDRHGAEAVLVRPDHHVFGAGSAQPLLAAWKSAVDPLRRAA